MTHCVHVLEKTEVGVLVENLTVMFQGLKLHGTPPALRRGSPIQKAVLRAYFVIEMGYVKRYHALPSCMFLKQITYEGEISKFSSTLTV